MRFCKYMVNGFLLAATLIVYTLSAGAVTFTVDNLGDNGAGTLRQAILDANANANGPGVIDVIDFQAGLTGTIALTTGEMTITDDVSITGPGIDVITIDGQTTNRIISISDGNNGVCRDVSVSGLTFTRGAGNGGAIHTAEGLTVDSSRFVSNAGAYGVAIAAGESGGNCTLDISGSVFSGNAAVGPGNGGAIALFGFTTSITDSVFSGNSAAFTGGVIYGESPHITSISGCTFTGNRAAQGGVINVFSNAVIDEIVDSTFIMNAATGGAGGVIRFNGQRIDNIESSVFSGNSATGAGGVFELASGQIVIISDSLFDNNSAVTNGGVINNNGTLGTITNSTFSDNHAADGAAIYNNASRTIKGITNCTFNGNVASDEGGAIYNNDGLAYVNFSTIADNSAVTDGGGIFEAGPSLVHTRNSIVAFNKAENCAGSATFDEGGNYSNDTSCGYSGDSSNIVLGPLADNGGNTETRALISGDPIEGAQDCDGLVWNTTTMMADTFAVDSDQRGFPRPFSVQCDSGSYEAGPSTVTITNLTIPSGGTGYSFNSTGFAGLQNCGLTGPFTLDDQESANCVVPSGAYTVTEQIPAGQVASIFCNKLPAGSTIDSLAGSISFTVAAEGDDVDCTFVNSFADTLVNISDEPPGANCEEGGAKIESGRDTNQNGVLDPAEMEDTFYLCNGVPGEPSEPGEPGEPGQPGEPGEPGTSIVEDINVEPPGPNCPNGGFRFDSGPDANKNGILDADEIDPGNTFYVCNGQDGSDGEDGSDGSNGGCAIAGSGGTKAGIGGLLVLSLIPGAVLVRRRYRK